MEVYDTIFESESQALVIGLSVGGVIVLVACLCFGFKVRKLKYEKLSSEEKDSQTGRKGESERKAFEIE